jgi:MFS transporter, SET family, sugar efflux transporter
VAIRQVGKEIVGNGDIKWPTAVIGRRRGVTTSRMSFTSLAAAILLLGIADSMVGSYLVLFAADEAGMEPLQIGVFASAPAVGGILASWLLGRRFDRHPTRTYTVSVTALGAAGLGLMTLTTSFPVLVALALTLLGGLSAAFPQLFAMARVVLGDGRAGQRSAPLLRSAWSLAWAIGPLIGAALVTRAGFTTVLWSAAAVLTLTALVTLTVAVPELRVSAAVGAESGKSAPAARSALTVAVITSSVTLFFTAMFAGSVALPLYITRALHQTASAVGVLFSVCAAVEVVAALALAALPGWISQRLLILGGMAAFVVYFSLTVLARGMALLVIGQLARGIAIAVVGAAGIRYFQDLLAPAIGRATTLFSNASTAGSLVAGVLAGAAVRWFGYTTALVLCGVVAVMATATFAAGTAFDPRQRRAVARHGAVGADRDGSSGQRHPTSARWCSPTRDG